MQNLLAPPVSPSSRYLRWTRDRDISWPLKCFSPRLQRCWRTYWKPVFHKAHKSERFSEGNTTWFVLFPLSRRVSITSESPWSPERRADSLCNEWRRLVMASGRLADNEVRWWELPAVETWRRRPEPELIGHEPHFVHLWCPINM